MLDWKEYLGCWQGKAVRISKGAEFAEWIKHEVPEKFKHDVQHHRSTYIKIQWLYKARKIVSDLDFETFIKKAPPKYHFEMRTQREK